MGLHFLEIWIINKAGLTLMHAKSSKYKNKQTVNPILFSGILSAVETIAAESLHSIKMNDSKLVIFPNDDPSKLFIVARVLMKDKENNVLKILKKINIDFLEEFKEILSSWSGDQTIFHYFQNKCIEEFM
ncbi:MAG: hypothetical protein ACTSVU_06960 [Promethearchaeota archaeon]